MDGRRWGGVRRGTAHGFLLAMLAAPAFEATGGVAQAQWSRTYESTYLPGGFNWQFRERYSEADRLFNAFDYGHAILYETLWTDPRASVSRLETEQYDYITNRLLPNPPRLPLVETAIEPNFARLAPEVKAMLDWAHLLHRQVYDVWADPSIAPADKDARVLELLNYYRSRPELAFSAQPKSMDIMDGQLYSLAFRQKYPKFNGLVWSYHWLQIGLYEPLMTGRTDAERKTLVDATVGRFRQMLGNAPTTMPYLMPMTPAIAPTFARRYPELGAIFDNLHMMHDVVSDILTSPEIPRSAKRKEILEAAAMFRSDTAFAIPVQTWLQMGQVMGVNNMGGPAVGFGAALPQPTVARGMSMAGMEGMQHGAAGTHGAGASSSVSMPGMNMSGSMPGMNMRDTGQSAQGSSMAAMMAMHERMMADPVIRERMMTDPVLMRMMREMNAAPSMPGKNMPGMNMPGMNMPEMAMGGSASAEDRRQAVEFLVRLFSDPAVARRIHADPQLERLWNDPDVQRRLAELRSAQPASVPAPRDSTPAPAPHVHP